MNQALKGSEFAPFVDERGLESAIESVCAEFGRVTYLKILPPRRGSGLRCACFLRLNSTAAEAALKSRFALTQYAGTLQFLVEVDDRWTGHTGGPVVGKDGFQI